MKGYSELRGQTLKMEFDVASGQFVSKPIAHAFAPVAKSNFVVQKLKALQIVRQQKQAEFQLKQLLSSMDQATRDDVGMAEVFAAIPNL